MPESKASCRYCRNNRRNKRESTRTGRKKCGRQEIHRVPSRKIPPPGTSEKWLSHWMAHELGDLAKNSAREDDAEKAAQEYRKRLKQARIEAW